MKIVLQRVKSASVRAEGREVSKIGIGYLLLVGIEKNDSDETLSWMAKKIVDLRIFPDDHGKMNIPIIEIGGEILCVSQFTLPARIGKGRRPSFDNAMAPETAGGIFNRFVKNLENYGLKVKTGIFRAMMDVELINDGPVTFILEYPR